MRYRYDRLLKPDEVFVHVFLQNPLARLGPHTNRAGLGERLKDRACRHGFTIDMSVLTPEALGLSTKTCLHSLAILVLDRPFWQGLEPMLSRYLLSFKQVSVALAYASLQEMAEARVPIEKIKNAFYDRVNFLRPDRVSPGRVDVSNEKIIDNSVCDSVRIKFIPIHEPLPIGLTAREIAFFTHASRLFKEHILWHRSASDGYFLLRRPEGFLVTATKTYKDSLDSSRISWVKAYDRASNRLLYSGEFLPSSDSVEAAVLLEGIPAIQALVHTHASDRWTRNPAYSERIQIPQMPYGEPELGDSLREAIVGYPSGFLIMVEHGEVFWSSQQDAGSELLRQVEAECAPHTST